FQLVNNNATHKEANLRASVVIVFSIIACGFLFWYRHSDPEPLPVITVEVGPNVFPENPFKTAFILENHGPGSIYKIQHLAWWNDKNGPGKRMFFTFGMT